MLKLSNNLVIISWLVETRALSWSLMLIRVYMFGCMPITVGAGIESMPSKIQPLLGRDQDMSSDVMDALLPGDSSYKWKLRCQLQKPSMVHSHNKYLKAFQLWLYYKKRRLYKTDDTIAVPQASERYNGLVMAFSGIWMLLIEWGSVGLCHLDVCVYISIWIYPCEL